MSTANIPERSQLRPEDQWNLGDLYPSDEAWQADFDAAKALAAKLPSYRGRLGSSARTLLEFARLDEEISLLLDKLINYAQRKNDEDTRVAAYQAMAAKATELPVEFFKLIPRGVMKRVAATVRGYLNVEAVTEHHVMKLEKPRDYKGKVYQEIDLNAIADLNSLNESEAENRLAREGFVVTENATNYLYACVIASMATGIPEDFFTSLPLYELLKLKNAVNDGDFFG